MEGNFYPPCFISGRVNEFTVPASSVALNGEFMQKSNAKPANVEIKPAALHEMEKNQ